tara:strand:- start:514 stop:672 length:159 start_codon:yes stop_codon:yes gene_type:complete
MNIKRQFKRKEIKRCRKANGIKKYRPLTGSLNNRGSNNPWTVPLITAKQSWN